MLKKHQRKNKAFFEIKAAAKKDTAEIYLYDEIGESFWGGGISAEAFVDAVMGLDKDVKNLNVHINSPGGSVFEGVAMYNALKSFKGEVTTYIDGMALSIASVIALAGDNVVMANNAFVMIHDPWSMAMGSADELRKEADVLDKIKGTMVQTYMEHSNLSEDEVVSAMSEETWYTGQEALDVGLVTELADEQNAKASFELDNFKNVPSAAKMVAEEDIQEDSPVTEKSDAVETETEEDPNPAIEHQEMRQRLVELDI